MSTQQPSKVEWWFFYTLCTFLALYLAIVFGGMTLGYLLREYIRDRIEAGQREKANPNPPQRWGK